MVATAAIRMQPFHAGDKLDDFEFLDLVIESANLRFLQLDLPPLDRLRVSHRLADFNDLCAGGDAFLSQLKKAGVGGGASFIGFLEDAEFAAADAAATDLSVAAAARFLRRGRGWGGRLAKTAKDFRDDVADQSFINGVHGEE